MTYLETCCAMQREIDGHGPPRIAAPLNLN